MKKLLKKIFLLSIVLSITINNYAQFSIDIVDDTLYICQDTPMNMILNVQIGENLSIQGGTAPYTYCWWIHPIHSQIPNHDFYYYASQSINDTTLANPVITTGQYLDDIDYIYLTVTDNSGISKTDSVFIIFSYFQTDLADYRLFTIDNIGDSVFIDSYSHSIYSVQPREKMKWFPSDGLSVDTLDYNFWAKPTCYTEYTKIITDIYGCQSSANSGPSFIVTVNTSNVQENKFSNIKIFPNPTTGIFYIQGANNTNLQIYYALSKIVLEKEIKNDVEKIDLSSYPAGSYIIKINDGEDKYYNYKIIVNR